MNGLQPVRTTIDMKYPQTNLEEAKYHVKPILKLPKHHIFRQLKKVDCLFVKMPTIVTPSGGPRPLPKMEREGRETDKFQQLKRQHLRDGTLFEDQHFPATSEAYHLGQKYMIS